VWAHEELAEQPKLIAPSCLRETDDVGTFLGDERAAWIGGEQMSNGALGALVLTRGQPTSNTQIVQRLREDRRACLHVITPHLTRLHSPHYNNATARDVLERRRRIRVVRAKTILVLVAFFAVTGCSGGRGSEKLGRAPQKLETHLYVCPADFDTIGYRRRAYPSMYPARPGSGVRPDRCFRSIAQAEHAGYRLAPTPSGATRVGDVYLVPPVRRLAADCRHAAQVAGMAVPCPTLVPVPADSVGGCVGVKRCVRHGVFILEGSFNGPRGYVGVGGRGGHLLFLAAAAGKASEIECCGGVRTKASFAVLGQRASWLEYPSGSELNSGHVALEWRKRGVVYLVSLHGHSELNRRLDKVLAKRVQLVTPESE
jgi:hypothetical protein